MLVLSRRPNEKILFPAIEASVQVLSVKAGVVRLGIEAPPEVKVLREELAALAPPAVPGPFRPATAASTALERLASGLEGLRAQLPPGAAAALAEVEAELAALRRLAGPASRAGRPVRALLVEDNPHERELLALLLRRGGLNVDTAGDGADALDYLRSHSRPDVILLDMGLPRCDGPTAVRAIRRDPACAGVKIVAVSGHPAGHFDLARGPSGVDRWFQKPLDPDELLLDLRRECAGAEDRP